MRRLILSLSLALFVILLVASPALAGRRWCARDPIVSLDGNHLQVWVAIPEEYVYLVNGPIEVTFKTPAGITRSVVMTDDGFNGHGEVVTFVDDPKSEVNPNGSFTVRVWVSVPIDEAHTAADIKARRIPTQITVVEGNTTQVLYGWNTGSWITTNVNIGK
jgi:hypothetical protein